MIHEHIHMNSIAIVPQNLKGKTNYRQLKIMSYVVHLMGFELSRDLSSNLFS